MDIKKLFISILVSLAAGWIGSLFTATSVSTWYVTLEKPALNPPSWVFGPVWTLLFILIGIAVYLVWQQGLTNKQVRIALAVFIIQLVLNIGWSYFFFYLQNPLWAFIEIVILWMAIVVMMTLFYRLNKFTVYLLLPYIAWVSFASYLNVMIWQLN